MRCAVVGAGSWGTALGSVLASKGDEVLAWDVDAAVLDAIAARGENTRYLPGIPLPPMLSATPDLAKALDGAELVVVAVPSPVVRSVTHRLAALLAPGAVVCSAVKGVEVDTLATMSEVLQDVLPPERHRDLAFLSGPSFAKEVAAGMPTAVTVASSDEDVARRVQQAFHTATFRPYTTTDVVGVELGGCVKNVIAIAAGMAEGLGHGANARAALITRGLAEMTRLAVRRGAEPVTLMGLAGIGDLVLTCSSDLSRNHTVGVALGRGETLEAVQTRLGQVAEGVVNARSTVALARRYDVSMPISETVHAVLYEGLPPREAGVQLMLRDIKSEAD